MLNGYKRKWTDSKSPCFLQRPKGYVLGDLKQTATAGGIGRGVRERERWERGRIGKKIDGRGDG